MTNTNYDPLRFSTIAHSNHRYLSPLSQNKAHELLRSFVANFSADDIVLDAGCGKAALLRDVLHLSPARGVGVDINQSFLDEARAAFQQDSPNDSRLSLINAPLLEHTRPEDGYAAILCVGSTHAFGSFEECLRVAFDWLKPEMFPQQWEVIATADRAHCGTALAQRFEVTSRRKPLADRLRNGRLVGLLD